MKPAARWLCRVCAMFAWIGVASATPIPVTNPGFEDPAQADGGFTVFNVPGWTFFGGVGYAAGTFNPTVTQYQAEAPEGANVGWLVSYNSAGLSQTLATNYQAGNTYTLSVLVGDRDDHTGAVYEILLSSGGVVFATTGLQPIPAEGDFSLATISFDADARHDGLPIEIALLAWPGTVPDPDQPPDASGSIADFDDVRLDATPTSFPGAGRVPLLILDKTPAGDLLLEWQPSCSSDDADYAVFSGDIGSFASHSWEVCTTAGSTVATVALPAGDRYYLVVPLDGGDEGSYGVDGNGAERPPAVANCGPQNIDATCP